MKSNKSVPSIFDYEYDDFTLINYDAHEHIKTDVAVSHPLISLVVALDKNYLIGNNNKIPGIFWRIEKFQRYNYAQTHNYGQKNS